MTLRIGCFANHAKQQSVKPDDHSEVVPLLPIPNRTVKRLSADDSAGSRVKVGHRQATIKNPPQGILRGVLLCRKKLPTGVETGRRMPNKNQTSKLRSKLVVALEDKFSSLETSLMSSGIAALSQPSAVCRAILTPSDTHWPLAC